MSKAAPKENASRLLKKTILLAACLCTTVLTLHAQPDQPKTPPVPGPMLAQGTIAFDTPEFALKLVRSSQTIAALVPKGSEPFDFTPADLLTERSQDGYYHLGDLDLRLRVTGKTAFTGYSTALSRHPITPLPASGNVLAAADLAPTLPSTIPLQVVREWRLDAGKLVLQFTLRNTSSDPVEIGSLAIPMVFNNVMNDRTLEQAHAVCSFYDPYIGEDAGYLQVTRLSGKGPALLVVPAVHTPFEAWNPIPAQRPPRDGAPLSAELFHDRTPRGTTFEGFYEWMVHSGAYQQDEWKNAQPWNPPTTSILKPGESRVYAVTFLLSDSIRHLEQTLAANHRPVTVGVPGYVLPQDMQGQLFLKYPSRVQSIAVEPAGAIDVQREEPAQRATYQGYRLTGKIWGRARLSVTYEDGLLQTINYMVIKPEAEAVADLGHFLTTKQWFVDPADPFHRNPSAISYDREVNRQVTQDSRVWIAGLSDEAGADSWLALAMKESGEPEKAEVTNLEEFVDKVLWGNLQYAEGAEKFGVRKSLFYYQPDKLPPGYYDSTIDWKSWTSWNQKASEAVDRSYNYPHVASAYWAMYHLARNHPGLITNHEWNWYLEHAYQTTMAMMRLAPYYTQFGQMEGDIFVMILDDLKREAMKPEAAEMEAAMRRRADHWNTEQYPFGSEMPWDSTGQEEVYAWTKYFGYQAKADTTLDAILGYDPTLPSWGYNGSARRYWDFIYGGKQQRLERQLHHYGSGINAIPLLAAYREHPDDLYLLRVGYGGTMGELTNIDQEGFGSAAFHAGPDKLAFDGYSGDYGSGFWGYAVNTATYVVKDPELGWLGFGGNVEVKGSAVAVAPLDSFRSRLYLAPAGLWLTLDAGRIVRAVFDAHTGSVRLTLAPKDEFTPEARLRVEQPARLAGVGTYHPAQQFPLQRGAYVVPLGAAPTEITLRAK